MKPAPTLLIAAVATATLTIAGASNARQWVLGLVALAFFGAILRERSRVSMKARYMALGAIIGVGNLPNSYIGGFATYLVLVGVLLVIPGASMARLRATVGFLLPGLSLVVVGVVCTAITSAVSPSMLLTVVILLVGILGAALSTSEDRNDLVPGLIVASVMTSLGVLLSRVLDRPLVAGSEQLFAYSNDATAGFRSAGFLSAPNEAGIVLSGLTFALTVTLLTSSSGGRGRSIFLAAALILSVGTLMLTGSRSSVLGLASSVVLLLIIRGMRRPLVSTIIALAGFVGAFVAIQAGGFGERGLDVLADDDLSGAYRAEVQSVLWTRISWTSFSGAGFEQGRTITDNPILGGFPNIDNAWLAVIIGFGAVFAIGLALVIASSVVWLMRLRHDVLPLAALPWIAILTSAENVWLLLVPTVVVGVVVLASAGSDRNGEAIAFEEGRDSARVEHAVGGRG